MKSQYIIIILFIILSLGKLNGQTDKWIIFTPENIGKNIGKIRAISIDRNSEIWFGSEHNGLARYDGENWNFYNKETSEFLNYFIWGISVDANGNLWIATYDKGLIQYDGNIWRFYDILELTENRADYNACFDIAVDSKNNVWVGTYWGGLLKYDGAKWINYHSENSPMNSLMEEINCIEVDINDNIWCGTDATMEAKGIFMFDGIDKWQLFTGKTQLNYTYSIKSAKNGEVWANGNYLYKYDGQGNWFKYNNININWDFTQAIEIDKNNIKWFVGDGNAKTKKDKGICMYNDTSLTVIYPDTNAYDFGEAMSIIIDGAGNKWIGYSNGFIAVYNENGIEEILTNVNTESKIMNYDLEQNYPNPFNPTTSINYSLRENSFVVIKVYDILGNEITTLVNDEKPKGDYSINFSGNNLSSGIYFYQMKANGIVITKKMLLIR